MIWEFLGEVPGFFIYHSTHGGLFILNSKILDQFTYDLYFDVFYSKALLR